MKRNQNLSNAMWVLVLVVAVVQVVRAIVVDLAHPIQLLFVFLPIVFGIIHAKLRYGWRGMLVFVISCLVLSNVFENMSVLTGFPFGDYYWTDVAGVKLFNIPLLVGPSYLAIGYLSWVLATIIVGDVYRKSSWFTTIVTPMIGAFFMVAWDLTMDPIMATIDHVWIWEQGGGFFGVPLSNFLGWFFVVYVFMQVFALYLRSFRTETENEPVVLHPAYEWQALVLYAFVAINTVVRYMSWGDDVIIADPTGLTWQTASIAETSAIMAIFVMLFGVAIAIVNLVRNRTSKSA